MKTLNTILDVVDSKRGIIISLLFVYLFAVFFTIVFITPTAFGPVHQGDENRYWEMALEIYRGTFTLAEYHHSPLFYPLTIVPAFLFYPAGSYTAAKILNSLYISSVIFPGYLILRNFASKKFSLLTAIVLLLNPAQIVFPRQTLSENVFYPLLLWALLFSTTNLISTRNKWHTVESFIFGLVLISLLATRFISFAIIPVMAFIWWFKPHLDEKKPLFFSFSKVKQALVVALPMILILGIWIIYGSQDGLTFRQLFGFEIASDSNPLQLTFSRLGMWTSLYISYVILIAAPMVGILIISPFQINWKNWQDALPRFIIAVILVIVSILVGSIRHSWRAGYNFPNPDQLMGRYVFYAGPLILLACGALLSSVKLPNLHSKDWGYWLFSFLTGGIILLAYGILYEGWFFLGRPSKISGTSTDDYFLSSIRLLFIPATIMVNMIIAWFMGRNPRRLLASFLITLCVFYIYGDISLFFKRVMPQQFYTLQAYHFLEAAQNDGVISFSDPESAKIIVKTEPGVSQDDDESLAKWLFTLRVYGFRNVIFDEDARLGGQADAYKFIVANNIEYAVDGVNKVDFLACDCEKYEFLGNYYTVRPVATRK